MRTCVHFLVCVGFLCSVSARGVEAPTITSRGEASSTVLPTRLEFKLQASYAGDGLESAMADALGLPEQFEELLNERGLEKVDVVFRSPMISNAGDGVVEVKGTLRVGVPRGSDREEQAIRFAELCSDLVSLGRELNVAIGGPELVVEEREVVEQETLKRATENALYKADAIALVLKTQIYEVQSVDVVELVWHDDISDAENGPGLDGVTCSATVSLTYLHSP